MELFQGLEFANDVVRGGDWRFFKLFDTNGFRSLIPYLDAHNAHDGRDQEAKVGDESEEYNDGLHVVGGIGGL